MSLTCCRFPRPLSPMASRPALFIYSKIAFLSLGKPAVAAALSAFWPWSQLPTQNPSQIGFQMVNLINFRMECTKLKSESIQIDCLDPPVNSRVSIHFVLLVMD